MKRQTNIIKYFKNTLNIDDFYLELKKNGVCCFTHVYYQSKKSDNIVIGTQLDKMSDEELSKVVEEVDRLAELGIENMSAREKQVFKELAEYRQNAERSNELSKLGVTEDVYNSKEFKDFASKFGTNTTITEIYEIYNKMQPKKEVRTMGSLKNNTTNDTGVKDFYTRDEALKFTKKDFDNNPELFKAVEKSMLKW